MREKMSTSRKKSKKKLMKQKENKYANSKKIQTMNKKHRKRRKGTVSEDRKNEETRRHFKKNMLHYLHHACLEGTDILKYVHALLTQSRFSTIITFCCKSKSV